MSDDIDLLEKPIPAAALLARVRQAIDTSAQNGADGTAGADGAPADGPHARVSRGGRARTKGGRVRPG